MKIIRHSSLSLLITLLLISVAGCVTDPGANSNSPSSSPSPGGSPSPQPSVTRSAPAVSVTLPVLDALFSDEAFKSKLKAKVELTDDQIAQLQKIAADEVAKLRQLNAEEQSTEQLRQADESRQNASESIRGVVGDQKADALFAYVLDYWVKGGEEVEASKSSTPEPMLPGPNAVPRDTRIVVNIPAFRMDVFDNGSLIKSYKIGIGYPDFPLPSGLRKAQTIIFNPTWTPPDEPWVAKMRNVSVGEKVEAGSKLNPLGPIKIPIGLPSLIHGGKSPAKLGTFASHGCVGLTTAQVQDFAKLLAKTAGTELSDKVVESHLRDKTQTKVVKLDRAVPVELRYETIVLEDDGKLHIYRDVYDQDTNTEDNLRTVFQANGLRLEDLSEAERTQILEALNAMSHYPKKNIASTVADASPAAAISAATDKSAKKGPAPVKKPIGKNQKEVVVELGTLKGKGYPTAVNLDTGRGKPAAVAIANSVR